MKNEKMRWNKELVLIDALIIIEFLGQMLFLLSDAYRLAFWVSLGIFIFAAVYFFIDRADCPGYLFMTSLMLGFNPVFFLIDSFRPGCWFGVLFMSMLSLVSAVSANIRISNGYSAY
ncbi:MAG: hypothetical protein K6G36_03180 [Candidatus Saccharibacteria bacterium]|nr:hypothetical protein [Candidatus Saccharibacteria bacterium]